MERRTLFADVILPLALPKMLTYRVPFELNDYVIPGVRVIVQLGKAKLYTAIVRNVHENLPEYPAKFLEGILDETPVVNSFQFSLWDWMAGYYMCTLGEVMNAALPSSLKLASETKLVLNEDWDRNDSTLSDKEFLVAQALQLQEVLTLKEVSEILDQKTVMPVVKKLIEKRVLFTEEDLLQRYKPRVEEFLRLTPEMCDDDRLQEMFDTLEKRAPKQLEMLMAFFHHTGNVLSSDREIGKVVLQKAVGAQSSMTQKLVERGVFDIIEKEIGRIEQYDAADLGPAALSESQNDALQAIRQIWQEKDVALLHGVTGSGKTEVYIHLIQEVLDAGGQVLYLLPEIALTTQIINRLSKYFGPRIGVYHSRFNQNERVEIWNQVQDRSSGRFDVVLGARSAVFLPFSKLQLVIVDEEHESSFKQYDPAPRYNGRDMGLVLARMHRAKVLLGSATPSVESYWNAKEGHYGLVELHKRYGGIRMPEIQCADIRHELKHKTMKGNFTSFLATKIENALEAGEQIILFQNRRGYAPLWRCNMCTYIPECKRCDVNLTYHKHSHQLKCHYCGFSQNPPTTCPACGSSDIKMVGFGTEKIEEEMEILFPKAVVRRMDLDTTRSKHAYQRIISDFEVGEIDILVGTQMVTKGLDFDNVGLVGILNADQMINFPDFRSMERSFQLMTQVAGRAGRRNKRGLVVIQTYTPDHWVIQRVMENDYTGLFEQENLERRNFWYPPYYRLIRITLKHKDRHLADAGAIELITALKSKLGERVMGPEVPYVSRINNWHLRNIMIKVERDASAKAVKGILQQQIDLLSAQPDFKSMRAVVDVDPM
ncbi:MAG: primosomal protein N' [Flavobacteriales bacterium]|nr:primosomal protein N' [Flavobacteriales bacterium]